MCDEFDRKKAVLLDERSNEGVALRCFNRSGLCHLCLSSETAGLREVLSRWTVPVDDSLELEFMMVIRAYLQIVSSENLDAEQFSFNSVFIENSLEAKLQIWSIPPRFYSGFLS